MLKYIFSFSLLLSPAYAEDLTSKPASVESVNGFKSFSIPLSKISLDAEGVHGTTLGKYENKMIGFDFDIAKSNQGEYSIKLKLDSEAGRSFFGILKSELLTNSKLGLSKSAHLFEANETEDSGKLSSNWPDNYLLINLHDEENYGEWYFVISEKLKTVTLSEKNESYREALVKTLATSK